MTPERWQQIGLVFDEAIRIAPDGRDAWLRTACAGDDELRADVSRLLADDDRANRAGLLSPPVDGKPDLAETGAWQPLRSARATQLPLSNQPPLTETGGFTPRPAIIPHHAGHDISEPQDVVRARLRELPMIYLLILASAALWRRAIFGPGHLALYQSDAVILSFLVLIIGLLWSRLTLSLTALKALELVMIGTFAGRLAFVQYRMMLAYSLRDDPMLAQLTMKNVVLLISILILTYGLYVPKSWRRAALVVGPLAALPFATLLALAVMHPEPMSWLGQGWRRSNTPRIWLFTFDALILAILAVGSTFGARAISRLRRQVVEARQFGQYRLRKRIGSGGMGDVFLAEHQLLKRPCALKLIRAETVAGARALERFEREVRLTATLSHPNTVEVYDYGRSDDGTYYYVMEYLPGLNLAELVERYGPLPPPRAVYLLRQVCGALREAHAAGLIHRDIKPSNIFAACRGGMNDVAKLLDFGLVRPAANLGPSQLSDEGRILGTPLFMSPEQATDGRELDARTDIYSLGAVAFYLLTGRPPFDTPDGLAAIIAHARDPVVPPSELQPGIPRDVELVVMRCLAKNASERFPDAASLERALANCTCAGDWDALRAAQWWSGSECDPAVAK